MAARRILVIDDDELSRELVRSMLARLGLEATGVETGAEGLAALAEPQDFDLVITDLKLPDIDGMDLVSRLRQTDPAGPPVLVISGAEETEGRERCQRAGCAAYLAKPFTFQEFEAVVVPLLEALE